MRMVFEAKDQYDLSFPLFFAFQPDDIMPPILSHADC